MEHEPREATVQKADQYVLRFCESGQRQRLKAQAKAAKRSLNNYLLILIEAGEKAIERPQEVQA